MDFTREPIIETVITPKEGCKLVIRSSKTVGQEEYFVDAVEVVSFGSAIFFRSLERPKSFIVPVSDYEVLEVREARIVLKNVGLDRSIKIGGGRDSISKPVKEIAEEASSEKEPTPIVSEPTKVESRSERKRDRRRQYRKKRNREEGVSSQEEPPVGGAPKVGLEESVELALPQREMTEKDMTEAVSMSGSLLSNLLSPPPLISETIGRYKEKFRDAFYTKEEQEARLAEEEIVPITEEVNLALPAYGSFEMSEADEEEIYRQRKRRIFLEDEENEVGEEGKQAETFPQHEESIEESGSLDDYSSPSVSEPTQPHEVPTSTEIFPVFPPAKEDV
ncbi:hypothetical protein PHSC3_001914 [Chlamydiales bacterium STE3]|nr:hypothetical protein PHSC3_001914 [Chlamydiales bacterium STE3]